MPRMPKYLKREWAFFLGDCGRKKYNPLWQCLAKRCPAPHGIACLAGCGRCQVHPSQKNQIFPAVQRSQNQVACCRQPRKKRSQHQISRNALVQCLNKTVSHTVERNDGNGYQPAIQAGENHGRVLQHGKLVEPAVFSVRTKRMLLLPPTGCSGNGVSSADSSRGSTSTAGICRAMADCLVPHCSQKTESSAICAPHCSLKTITINLTFC